jgi:hypothetical protein
MAQTPVTASVFYNSTAQTTIYTVPVGKTAVVKGVLATSQVTSYDTVGLNKVSGGITYPIVVGQTTGYPAIGSSTYYQGYPSVRSINLLQSPITLAAGDSITISSSDTSYYKALTAIYDTTYLIANIAYLNGYYIAVGADTTGLGLILTSTDGITYTRRTFAYSLSLRNVTYGNGYYVVCNATGGVIHYSTDLITWTQVTLPSTSPCYALTYGGAKFVTGGTSGISYYATTTPLVWTASTVFSTDLIQSLSYIGTNWFYGTAGVSYYTADFTTYTQPYMSLASGQSNSTHSAICASNNKVMLVNNLTPSTYPNTFLRTSTAGVTWSAQTTTANSVGSSGTKIKYAANGAYYIMQYYNSGSMYYLRSSDGTTWVQDQETSWGLTGASTGGYRNVSPAYLNTTNATYQGVCLTYFEASSMFYIGCTNVATNGTMSGANFATFSASNLVSGAYYANMTPIQVGNPFNGSWRQFYYYYNGGNYGAPSHYGSSTTNGADGQSNAGIYSAGYTVCAAVLPNSPIYMVGMTNGWVVSCSTYSQSPVQYIGPSTVPTGITWGNISGQTCVGMCRGGELSTSPFVIIWDNGYTAVTTNQGATWTMVNVGVSGYPSNTMGLGGGSNIQFNNGKFFLLASSGLILTSTDGLIWETMPTNVESIYYLNSQNIYLSPSSLSVSATGVVNAFTGKTNPYSTSVTYTNRMAYANSEYYLLSQNNTLYRSSDLTTWSSKSFSTTTANDAVYVSSPSAVAYSGSGTSIVTAYARASSPISSYTSKPFTPSTSIYIGNATAAIVEIT